MTIILTSPIAISGISQPIGTTLTLGLAKESDLVNRGFAKWQGINPTETKLDLVMLNLRRQLSAVNSPLKKNIMAVPPTLAGQTAFVQPAGWVTPLANAVLIKALPVNPGAFNNLLRISAPEQLTVAGSFGFNDGTVFNFLYGLAKSGGGGTGMLVVRWCTDAPYFGMAFTYSPLFMLTINGEYISATPSSFSVAGSSSNYVSITNPSRAPREYCLMLSPGVRFGGLAVGPLDAVWAPSPPDLRIVADGDSYLQLVSSSFSTGIFAEIAMALGADYSCAPIGGTGYVAINGSFPNAQTRISQVTSAYDGKANIVLIALGINDPMDGTLKAGVTEYFSLLRSSLPNALFIVLGTWCPAETNGATYYAGRSAIIFAAVRAAGGKFILIDNINGKIETSWSSSLLSMGNLPWQTGTGKAGALTGVGNGDVYVKSDGVHATEPAGVDYLSDRVYRAIKIAISDYNFIV